MWVKEIDNTWTLFLDRDGVINTRIIGGYVTKINEFNFLPGVKDAISFFTSKFYKILVVTNQQGIAKGLMSECNLLEIHRYMLDELKKTNGIIDKCYFAPDIKSSYNKMRKPNSGMALAAKIDFPMINFNKSIMIGDTDSDILFGKNVGMKTVRIKTIEPIHIEADITVNSLEEFKILWENTL
jgi:D-glycero-D-manno-heptose 1,7-bisphosphate phosphatase